MKWMEIDERDVFELGHRVAKCFYGENCWLACTRFDGLKFPTKFEKWG